MMKSRQQKSYDKSYTISLSIIPGHYYYMEASSPRKPGDVARMFTLPIKARQGGKCTVRFYYHMFGKHVDSLNVYTLKINTGVQTLHFKANGDYGDMWRLAKLNLSAETEPFRVVFEGNSKRFQLSKL